MTPDALTFRIAKHADIVVTGRGVITKGEFIGMTLDALPSVSCWPNSWMHRRPHGAQPMALRIRLGSMAGRTGRGCTGWMSTARQ